MTKKELKQIEAIAEKLEGYKITLTTEEYIKKEENKTFSKKPNETTTEIINPEFYKNIFTSVNFFKSLGGSETITKGYTCAGLIPVRLTSISPNKTEKVVRIFKIDYK